MYFGAAYYPEHWAENRWKTDAKMMQEAGVNGVRMAEFAWSKIEPTEGEYDFAWLDRAVSILAEHGVKTMMCTCSRTPPPWVFAKYPEILNTRSDGHINNHGHRYTICHNNPTFIELSRKIDRAVIEHYAENENVTAWHIDNEIGDGNTCYCDICRRKFVEYLRGKYKTVENLNEKWGEHFWSFSFSSFEEIPIPVNMKRPSPNLMLEYARFTSNVNVDFALWRCKLIKESGSKAWVTTNFQGLAAHTDIFDFGEATDVYGTNFYPPYESEFALDYCRGSKGKLIILEQRSGHPHWSAATKPGWMRLWAYRSIAHGACGINFFRWRPCRWGQEEYWHGILPHSGRENRRYLELSGMGEELKKIGELIDSTRPHAKTAIVMSYESRWALNSVLYESALGRNHSMRVLEEAERYHEALMLHNVATDAMDPREDLSRYRLVIAPRLYCVDEKVTENLRKFVDGGGILCLTPRSGVVDEYNVIFEQPAPGPLAEIAGVEVDDYGSLEKSVPMRGELKTSDGVLKEATLWADEIIPTTAKVIATFDGDWLCGKPAITINEYGKGKVVYAGTVLQDDTLKAFVSWLCKLAGGPLGLKTPDGVLAYERRSDKVRLLFVMNFTNTSQTIKLDAQWEDLLSGGQYKKIELQSADVRIFKTDISSEET